VGKLFSTVGILLLSIASIAAQGTFQFTWHGDSNYFQATFQVTGAEMQPGANFSSDLFLTSMSVTNPLGQTYHGGDSSSSGSGSYIPWGLYFHLNDFQRNTELIVEGGGLSGSDHRTAGIMWEQIMSAPNDLWFERGYWSVAQVPEPSCTTLLGFSGLVLLYNKARKLR